MIDFADLVILSTNYGRQGTPVTMPSAEEDSVALSTMVIESLDEDLDVEHVPIEMSDAVLR